MTMRPATNRRAAIVAPVRTPVGTFGGSLRAVPVEELAATAIKAVIERTGIDPEIIDDVSFAQSYVNGETLPEGHPAAKGAMQGGVPTAYICQHTFCSEPITSAVQLDSSVAERIGDEIGRQTGRTVQLTSTVDPDVIGGIVLRVGNSILDASIRTRLESLRKQVARA